MISNFASRAREYHKFIFSQNLFVGVMMLLAIGLPVAPFLVGFSQFFLAFNWLMEGDFNRKWKQIKSDKALQAFLLVFFVHVVWLINTSDFQYAFHDMKIKLPFLILPIVITTGYPLNFTQLKRILLIFVATVVVGSFISLAVLFGFIERDLTDIRNISMFISHIRFGLMIVFSIFILGYYLIKSREKVSLKIRIVYMITMVWLILFLLILQSVTSWVILLFLTYLVIVFFYKRITLKVVKVLAWTFILLVPITFIALLSFVLNGFYSVDKINYDELPVHTSLGNKYRHYKESKYTENGHYLWLYYSNKELNEYWPLYSDMDYRGSDLKGQPIKITLIRYLTSKNLTKDAEGLKSLDDIDVKLIELGHASCVYRSKITPYIKMYELVWELNQYFKYGNPNAKTVSMRIEFFKAGVSMFKEKKYFGVGTGDVRQSFVDYYEKTNSKLKPEYRRRAHNQYLTFLLTFGIIGFVIVGYGFVQPIIINRDSWTGLVLVFVTIFLLSMINEDALETQSGATFFAFFYSLLILKKVPSE